MELPLTSGTHFGVVLLFGTSLNNCAVNLARDYKCYSEDPKWELNQTVAGKVRHLPHLSLLHLKIAEDKLNTCVTEVRKIARENRRFEGSFSSVRVFAGGWLFWLTPQTPELISLHKQVLASCAPLRDGDVSEITPDMSSVQKDMVKKYGFTNTGWCWNPHITLGKLDERKMHRVEPIEHLQEAHFGRIALVEIGRFGAVERIIEDFSLSNF